MTFEEILECDGVLAYTNKGSSMMPLIREGRDIMIIERKPAAGCRKNDVVLFVRPGISGRGRYVLHRILRVNDDGTYWIAGDNCVYGETVREENILGILTSLNRDGRTLTANDPLYRLYMNTWCRCYHLRFGILRLRRLAGAARRRFSDMIKRSDDQ